MSAVDYLRAIELDAPGLASFYGRRLDAPAEAARAWCERDDALAVSAVDYVRRLGLRVLPLAPGRKIPLGGADCCGGSHANGSRSASGDLATVVAWWREHPAANVGIATGHRVDVIDQDGPEGAVSWARIGRADAWPDVIGVACTPRAGGVHRYVRATGDGNGARIAPGIDYRGAGGYVVAPPSVVGGVRYSWAVPLELGRVR